MWCNVSSGKKVEREWERRYGGRYVVTYKLRCFSLGIVGVQVFLQLQHTKLQSLQQSTRDQLQQQDRTPHTLTHNTGQYIHSTKHKNIYSRTHIHIKGYAEHAALFLQNNSYMLLQPHHYISVLPVKWLQTAMQKSLTVSASSSTVGHCERDVMTSRELRNWLPIRWSFSPRKRTDACVMEPNFLWMLCVKQGRWIKKGHKKSCQDCPPVNKTVDATNRV